MSASLAKFCLSSAQDVPSHYQWCTVEPIRYSWSQQIESSDFLWYIAIMAKKVNVFIEDQWDLKKWGGCITYRSEWLKELLTEPINRINRAGKVDSSVNIHIFNNRKEYMTWSKSHSSCCLACPCKDNSCAVQPNVYHCRATRSWAVIRIISEIVIKLR